LLSVRKAYDAWAQPRLVESWNSTANPGLNTLGGSSSINGAQWTRPLASVPAGWGIAGLDAAAAERLYAKTFAQLQPGAPCKELQQTYIDARITALGALGLLEGEGTPGASEDKVYVNKLIADAGGRRRDRCTVYRKTSAEEGRCVPAQPARRAGRDRDAHREPRGCSHGRADPRLVA
jgi:hypothetical protein